MHAIVSSVPITERQFRNQALGFPGVEERSRLGQFPEFRFRGRKFASLKRPRLKRPANGGYLYGLGEARMKELAGSRIRGLSIAYDALRVELSETGAASFKKLIAEAYAATRKARRSRSSS